jgi:hypothetical protein
MKTIQARVTRNLKEDPSIEECDVWNVETVLLEKLPNEEVSLIADPDEIQVEQIPGSKLDTTRNSLRQRTCFVCATYFLQYESTDARCY